MERQIPRKSCPVGAVLVLLAEQRHRWVICFENREAAEDLTVGKQRERTPVRLPAGRDLSVDLDLSQFDWAS